MLHVMNFEERDILIQIIRADVQKCRRPRRHVFYKRKNYIGKAANKMAQWSITFFFKSQKTLKRILKFVFFFPIFGLNFLHLLEKSFFLSGPPHPLSGPTTKRNTFLYVCLPLVAGPQSTNIKKISKSLLFKTLRKLYIFLGLKLYKNYLNQRFDKNLYICSTSRF